MCTVCAFHLVAVYVLNSSLLIPSATELEPNGADTYL